jgi:hypothetical protein
MKIRVANIEAERDDIRATYDQALTDHAAEKTTVNENVNMLNNIIQQQIPLVKCGRDCRERWFESSKRRMGSGGSIVTVRGEPDRTTIDKGSKAAHNGHIICDAAMLENDQGLAGNYSELFIGLYGVSYQVVIEERDGIFAPGSKMVEITNLHGTISHCLSFTRLSHDKGADEEFLKLFEKCWGIYLNLANSAMSGKTAQEVVRAFNADKAVERALVRMREICDEIVRAEKARLRPHCE